MISITDLNYFIGGRALYENASLHIDDNDKIGLIGLNGTGKSTLLRLIHRDAQPDSGTITMSKDTTIGYLNQDLLSYESDESILHVALQAFDEVVEMEDRIEKIIHSLEKEYSDKKVQELTELQEKFTLMEGYAIRAKAEEVLEGIGFSTDDLIRPLKEFSGGWRMRVMLARLLLESPSLLMLDEPTNHLDLPSIQWLENYLQEYPGAIIVVSHDRRFLNKVSQKIVEVTQRSLHVYQGNYDFYEEEKALRQEVQQNAYENQQQKIKQTERFIERFRSKATKARQVQSRIKMLEKMEMVDEVIDDQARVNFKFTFGRQPGKIVAELNHLSKSFGPIHIFEDTSAIIERGDKIALVGANGKGKSTLLRILDGSEPISGERRMGYNVQDAFYAQHQLESLHLENDLVSELQQTGTNKSETELRGLLGCFLFSKDEVYKKVKVLSGGEKSRVALAKVLLSEANFLLLDEPTNHLDMISVRILTQALQQYEGTYVVVSHDRHFVSQIANKIWYIENHQLKEYPGTYDEFEYWWKNRQDDASQNDQTKPAKPKAKQQEPASMPAVKEISRWKGQLKELEQKIEQLEKDKTKIEEQLSKSSAMQEKQIDELSHQFGTIEREIEKLTKKWEELFLRVEESETTK